MGCSSSKKICDYLKVGAGKPTSLLGGAIAISSAGQIYTGGAGVIEWYNKPQADAIFLKKADAVDITTVYTKVESDAKYTPKDEAYKKADSDLKYLLKTDNPIKTIDNVDSNGKIKVHFIDGSTTDVNVGVSTKDLKLKSGVYKSATKSIDFIVGNGVDNTDDMTISIPVNDLLPVESDNVTIVGDGSSTNKLAVKVSTTADNALSADGNGLYVHKTGDITVKEAIKGKGTVAEPIKLKLDVNPSNIAVITTDGLLVKETIKKRTDIRDIAVALDDEVVSEKGIRTELDKKLDNKYDVSVNQREFLIKKNGDVVVVDKPVDDEIDDAEEWVSNKDYKNESFVVDVPDGAKDVNGNDVPLGIQLMKYKNPRHSGNVLNIAEIGFMELIGSATEKVKNVEILSEITADTTLPDKVIIFTNTELKASDGTTIPSTYTKGANSIEYKAGDKVKEHCYSNGIKIPHTGVSCIVDNEIRVDISKTSNFAKVYSSDFYELI